jgi:D-alanyl-D-alanine dipeptidase
VPRSFGEPLARLRAVPIKDNGEPFVDPRTLSKRLHFAAKHPKFPDMPRTPEVRRRVAEMIARAAESLPPGTDITIIEGYRPLHQQRFMYEELRAEFVRKHPEWSRATLHRVTNQMSAPHGDPSPPPHTTGGAVDLCLCRASDLEYLDMTSPFAWDETSAPTRMKGLSPEAVANRRLLIGTLEAVGLTSYAGEWWHWSYGDQGWALRTGAAKAVYDRLPEGK